MPASETFRNEEPAARLYACAMTTTPTKVLLLDDDLRLRALLERYLAEQGMAVRAVGDARA